MFCRRRRSSVDFDEEIRSHIAFEADRLMSQGMSREEAIAAARRAFGSVSASHERFYESQRSPGLDQCTQDLRYAGRQFRQNPAFTIVAVLILALGIGANTSIFSLIDTFLIKPLPVQEPSRLYRVRPGVYGFSYAAYELLRAENQTFSDTFTFFTDKWNVIVNGEARFTSVELVTGNYFSGLGVRAAFGRTIGETDSVSAANPAAVISYAFWRSAFATDPSALGSVLSIGGVKFTVVGIAPAGFFGESIESVPDVWVPLAMLSLIHPSDTRLSDSATLWMDVMARLKPGVSETQAQANLDLLLPAVRAKLGIAESARPPLQRLELLPSSGGISSLREQYSLPLRILMTIVGAVLVIACANVANLLMSRGTVRRREVAVRLAIGAARSRVVRQLLTENLLLAVAGGVSGVIFAVWSTTFLLRVISNDRLPFSLDLRTFAFGVALTLLTGVLFGVMPALRATRLNLTPILKEGGRGTIGSRQRLGRCLVILQVALSLLLLTGAGLFVRTLYNLKAKDLGFDPKNLLLITIEPGQAGYKGSALVSLYQEILERVNALPQVQSASMSRFGLIGGGYASRSVSVPGYTPPAGDPGTNGIGPNDQVAVNIVGPKFFQTVGIPLLAGRDLSSADTAGAARVAVVKDKFLRRYYGNVNPVGRTFTFRGAQQQFEIIGVVGDAKFFRLRNESPPTIFLLYLQTSNAGPGLERMFLAIRTGSVANVTREVTRELRSIREDIPVHDVRSQEAQLDYVLIRERLLAVLSGFFGVFALLLASIGLYGVMSYSVARRTNEIGVRIALGAQRGEVLSLVMRETLWIVAIGMVFGAGASLVLNRFVASILFDLAPNDPTTTVAAIALMSTIGGIAGYLPAHRASRVDPTVALRHE